MEQLLSLLKTIPEYAAMVSSLQDGESVAVTGIGQINRSHMIAGLCRSINRPMVVLCQDDCGAAASGGIEGLPFGHRAHSSRPGSDPLRCRRGVQKLGAEAPAAAV